MTPNPNPKPLNPKPSIYLDKTGQLNRDGGQPCQISGVLTEMGQWLWATTLACWLPDGGERCQKPWGVARDGAGAGALCFLSTCVLAAAILLARVVLPDGGE